MIDNLARESYPKQENRNCQVCGGKDKDGNVWRYGKPVSRRRIHWYKGIYCRDECFRKANKGV